MDWKDVTRDWTLFRRRVREQWSLVSERQLDYIGGSREQLVARIHEAYGTSRAQAKQQVSAWLARLSRAGR